MTYRENQHPDESGHALARLKRGNARFVNGNNRFPRIDAARRAETFRDGQHPFATVIACSDSRVPVELLFDQGMGDLFVVRVAGNVCAADETASAEFAVGYLGTPLLVVLGHRNCGMVSAVVRGTELKGTIPVIVEHIRPAVSRIKGEGLSEAKLIDAAVRENVWQSIADLFARSPAIVERVRLGALRVVGAVYDIETGRVQWLGEHSRQRAFIGAVAE
jgi:carbonic anhydrase